jgi:hypothetical protein
MKGDHPTKLVEFFNQQGASDLVATIDAVKRDAMKPRGPYSKLLGIRSRKINDGEALRLWILKAYPDLPEADLRNLVGYYRKELRKARHRLGIS